MLEIQTILVPIDFSDTADHALEIARSLARDHHAKLVLMTSPPPQPTPPMTEVYIPELGDPRLVEECRLRLRQLVQSITDLPVEQRLIMGAPGPSIVEAANEVNADMIVMGTHGRSGLWRMLMGSVAEYVLRHAACPVLAIKPQAAAHLRREVETGLTTGATV